MFPQERPPSRGELQDHYEDFVEDVFEELSKHGKVVELKVCENMAEHLNGNVYVLFPTLSLPPSLSLFSVSEVRDQKNCK